MNINKQHVMSDLWHQKLKKNIKSYYKTIYLGAPLYILLNLIFCYSFMNGFEITFWIIFLPMCLITTGFCIYFPLKAIKSYQNIVQSLEIIDDWEIKLNLINGRTLVLSQYEISDVFFKVGNSEKTAKSINAKNEVNTYTLIPDFYMQVIDCDFFNKKKINDQ